MTHHILILSKVIGTVSLGVLAGSSLTTSYVVFPAINQATDGGVAAASSSVLHTVVQKATKMANSMSMTAFVALSSAFMFAAPNARHPYLIYSALSVPVIAGLNYYWGITPTASFGDWNLLSSKIADSLSFHYGHGESGEDSGEALQATKSAGSSNSSISLEDLSSVDSNLAAQSHRNKTFKETNEPSLLGDSTYAHVMSDASDSDKGYDDKVAASNDASTVIGQGQGQEQEGLLAFKTDYANLKRLSMISALVYTTAFAISTVGIYGDLA